MTDNMNETKSSNSSDVTTNIPPRTENPPETTQKTKTCPACGQVILEEAIKCRFCKTDITETRAEDGMSSSQATFFYISILVVFGLILFFSKSVNLAFIFTTLYSLVLYLSLDKKNKK